VRTVLIGLGNPVVTDDGVGIMAARLIEKMLPAQRRVDVCEVYSGGMPLMDAMVGYERAVIIDAMKTGINRPGELLRLGAADLVESRNTASTHSGSLDVALETGRMLGLKLPDDITIWGIEAADVETFGEDLTAAVAESLPGCVERILEDILAGCFEEQTADSGRHK
jgi:hydrogenase maturation protease